MSVDLLPLRFSGAPREIERKKKELSLCRAKGVCMHQEKVLLGIYNRDGAGNTAALGAQILLDHPISEG